MLTVDPNKVCYIITKAREFDEQVAPEELESGSNPSDDGAVAILEARGDNPTYQELTAALDALNEDQVAELMALVWMGRGDFSADEWEEALDEARETQDARAVAYLLGTPMLGDLLEEGLSMLGHSCADVEKEHL